MAGASVKILVINLASAPERLADISGSLRAQGLDFERVDAVLGKSLEREDLAKFERLGEMKLTPGEIGCSLSHLKAWGQLLASSADEALVLEDDVHFSPNFAEILLKLRVPDKASVVKFETLLTSITASGPIQKIGNYKVFHLHSTHAGAAAYVLNRAAAERLSAAFFRSTRPIDLLMFDIEEREGLDVDVLQVAPAPCIQWTAYNPAEIPNHQKSIIGLGREADLNGDSQMKRSKLRRLLLPLYLALYSLRLSVVGRKRIDVKFS